jgi:DNA-binding NtrC family response regulator
MAARERMLLRVSSRRGMMNVAMKVMIVEPGDPRAGVVGILARFGCGLIVMHDAESATDLLQRIAIDVVVARYHLPGRSGVWLLQRVARVQPTAMRILAADDPRLDLRRLRRNAICHTVLPYPYRPEQLIESLVGIPSSVTVDDSSVMGL